MRTRPRLVGRRFLPTVRRMACRFSELVVDCRDPEALAAFWAAVLDYRVLGREEDGAVEIGPEAGFGGAGARRWSSAGSPTRRPGKLRLHIDVNPTDRDQDAELRAAARSRRRPGGRRPDRRRGLARAGRPGGQRVLPADSAGDCDPRSEAALSALARASAEDGVGQRVDQRVPGRLDDVVVHADGGPLPHAVGGVDQHPRGRARAALPAEDAHLVVGQRDTSASCG